MNKFIIIKIIILALIGLSLEETAYSRSSKKGSKKSSKSISKKKKSSKSKKRSSKSSKKSSKKKSNKDALKGDCKQYEKKNKNWKCKVTRNNCKL